MQSHTISCDLIEIIYASLTAAETQHNLIESHAQTGVCTVLYMYHVISFFVGASGFHMAPPMINHSPDGDMQT